MIVSLAKIISPYTVYPEIAAARFINITLATLTLINIYILVNSLISPIFAFLLTLLVATNQINILYSIDITNQVIYTFFLTLSLIFYHRSKSPLVYLLFGLLFLLRYESIVIPISIFIIEYYTKRSSLKIKNFLSAFVPIILWLIILNFHSRIGNSITGNAYLEEIQNGLKNLPNLFAFTSLIEIITFDSSSPTDLSQLFSLTTIGLCFFGAANSKSKPIVKIIYLIFGFHLLFLYIFPNFFVRYYIPIIWIMYLILVNQKSKIISFTIIFCLLAYNLARINLPSNYSQPQEMKEYRLVADWLNKSKFDKPTIVVIYEPHILKYFVTNPQIDVKYGSDTQFKICQDKINCICETLLLGKSNTNIFVITSAYSSRDLLSFGDQFTPIIHHLSTFDDKNIQNNKVNFKYLTTVNTDDNNHWANIWNYIPNKSSD